MELQVHGHFAWHLQTERFIPRTFCNISLNKLGLCLREFQIDIFCKSHTNQLKQQTLRAEELFFFFTSALNGTNRNEIYEKQELGYYALF